MKKIILLTFVLLVFLQALRAQVISVSAEKNNILYIEFDNPVTIAVENRSSKSLIIKTDNGEIMGSNGIYNFRPKHIGAAEIIIFEKIRGKLKEIGRKSFRVKYFITNENVVFAVGPCYKNCKLSKATLAAQEFARAQLQNSDFDLKLSLDSFTVIINSITIITNYGNKLNEKIKSAFTLLLNNDIVVFKNIYTKLPDGRQIELDPLVIEIIEEKL